MWQPIPARRASAAACSVESSTVKLAWKPVLTVDVNEETAATLMKLIDALEDDDDVQNVYANFDIDDAVLERLTAA